MNGMVGKDGVTFVEKSVYQCSDREVLFTGFPELGDVDGIDGASIFDYAVCFCFSYPFASVKSDNIFVFPNDFFPGLFIRGEV
jgi:hypothetical protein